MKNLALLLTAMSFTANTFAFTPYHKYQQSPQHTPTQLSKNEDFSGNWTGTCDEELVNLTVTQDKEHITLDWHIPFEEPSSFALNQLETMSNSSLKRRYSSMKYASLSYNSLHLVDYEFYTSKDGGTSSGVMELIIDKKEDTLVLTNFIDITDRCELQKNS